jgi:hypothetical protein
MHKTNTEKDRGIAVIRDRETILSTSQEITTRYSYWGKTQHINNNNNNNNNNKAFLLQAR